MMPTGHNRAARAPIRRQDVKFKNRGAIIRVEGIVRGFGIVPDTLLLDKDLSLRARAVVAYLYGRPPGWTPVVSALCGALGITDFAWRTLKRELEAAGLAVLNRNAGADGRFIWELVFDLSRYGPTIR